MTSHGCLHCVTYVVSRKKEPTKSIFLSECFKLDFWDFEKIFRNIMKFNRSACWINSKISNRGSNNTLMMFVCCHYCCSLLWGNYWRSLIMLWNSTSWSFLKLTVPVEVPLHPWDPFLISNCSMTGNSVENNCFVVLNVKLQVKLRFKIFYWLLKVLYTAFALNTSTNTASFDWNFLHILATSV